MGIALIFLLMLLRGGSCAEVSIDAAGALIQSKTLSAEGRRGALTFDKSGRRNATLEEQDAVGDEYAPSSRGAETVLDELNATGADQYVSGASRRRRRALILLPPDATPHKLYRPACRSSGDTGFHSPLQFWYRDGTDYIVQAAESKNATMVIIKDGLYKKKKRCWVQEYIKNSDNSLYRLNYRDHSTQDADDPKDTCAGIVNCQCGLYWFVSCFQVDMSMKKTWCGNNCLEAYFWGCDDVTFWSGSCPKSWQVLPESQVEQCRHPQDRQNTAGCLNCDWCW